MQTLHLTFTYLKFSWLLQIQANRSHLSLSMPALITFSPETSFIVQNESGKISSALIRARQTDTAVTNSKLMHNEACHLSLTLNKVCQERFNHSQHYSRYITTLVFFIVFVNYHRKFRKMLKCSFIC